MIEMNADSAMIGKLFARTPPGEELKLPQWDQVISDIKNLSTSANAAFFITADEGSGKTTFIKALREQARSMMDVVPVSPATPSTGSGWLLAAIQSWITSESRETRGIQSLLAELAESDRPILICVDSADLIQDEHLTGDILALLNIADSGNLRLSILILGTERKSITLTGDQAFASRLIYTKPLPRFSDSQMQSYIRMKCQKAGVSTDIVHQRGIEDIARESKGVPLIAMRQTARMIGHEIPVSRAAREPAGTKSKPGRKERQKNETRGVAIDELLAPPKT